MIEIRLAKPSDAAELVRVNDLFCGEGSNTADKIAESLKNNETEIVCVASEGSRIIGYICGYIGWSMSCPDKCGTVSHLYVMEEYRRQGVGRKLIEGVENEFRKRGVSHLHISTGTENLAAQTLYRSCGYKDTSEFILDKDFTE